MNMKTLVPLLLAVGLGLVTLIVAKTAMKPSAAPAGNTVTVVVAKREIPVGHELTAEDLGTAKMPAESAPSKYFRTPQDVAGRAVTTTIIKGQPVMETLLAPAGSGAGIAALVEPGMRAITIEINETTGLAGMLNPGARVDVLAAFRDGKTDQPITRTILQKIRVLAVGRNLSPNPGPDGQAGPPSGNVTLLVSQKQAQALQLAAQSGRPWLVLRNGRDTDETDATGTTMAEIRGDGRGGLAAVDPATTPATRPAAPPTWTIKVIRGGAMTEMSFPVEAPAPKFASTPMEPASPAAPTTQPSPDRSANAVTDITPAEVNPD